MTEARRLLARATQAFIDRTPIDWTALLSRVGTSPDRAIFENLRLLAAVRDAGLPDQRARATSSLSSLVAWLVVAIGSVETIGSFVVLAVACASGESAATRTPQVVLALAFAVACVPLATVASREPRHIFLLATYASAAGVFARSTLTGLSESWSAPLRGFWLEAFTPACLWQFALRFPRVRRFASFDLVARRTAAITWLLGGTLFGINLLVAHDALEHRVLAYFLRDHPGRLFWHLFALALVPAVGVIFVRARRAPSPERRKVARFAFALAFGSAPFFVSGIAWSVLPSVSDSFPGASVVDVLIVAALAATPILSTAAVVTDGPIEIRTVMRDRLRSLRNRTASRIFRRAGPYDEQLTHALERLRVVRGAREIAVVLAEELQKAVGASTVRVLVATRGNGFVDPLHDATRLPSDAVIVEMLRETTRLLDLSADGPLLALLPREERDWVAANDARLGVRLKQRDGSIGAVVVLGPKRSGASFGRLDRWLITALIAAVSASCDDDRVTSNHWEPAIRESMGSARLPPSQANDAGEAAFECRGCGVVAESTPLRCGCGAEAILAALPRHLGGKFVVARRLGAGGMGVVYLAHDTTLDRQVALKTLPELRSDAVTRLRDEARAMAALNHESLATIYGLELWRRTPVLVVEYFPAGTLARHLADGPMALTDAIALGSRLARALGYMHATGMLHRDLKPSNIGFSATGTAKLLDFGLATLVQPSTGDDGELFGDAAEAGERFAGTPAYLPPEAYRGAPPTPAFDLWALSVTLLEAIAGVNPFSSDPRAATFQRLAALDLPDVCSRQLSSLPALRSFFERALDERPALRFRTCGELQSALETVARALTR